MMIRVVASATVLLAVLALAACSDGGSGSGAVADSGVDLPEPPLLALDDDTAPLTAHGEEAIAIAPAWLRHDLGLALRKQEAARADELAALLTGVADPRYIDEIAFSIAHTSPEVMANEGFYPELFALNAQLIYEHDEALFYVELVDTGVPGADDDFWTTAKYRYLEDGDRPGEKLIDRDIYYWYVVHPKMEDESPWFIDAWTACGATTLECAVAPYDPESGEGGWFWREFLWDQASEHCEADWPCPTLAEWLPGVPFVWNGLPGGEAEGAVREIVDLMRYQPVEGDNWLDFDSGFERSIQPNRIYGLGQGRCGEWADMTTALARTALIPNANASPSLWDHTWNSFYDDAWIEWEPVNDAIDADYSGWGSGFANANFYIVRGDGFVQMQTADYRDDWFTMEIEVDDANGLPVPGASVSVWQANIPDDGFLYYTGEGPTDADGVATFELTAMHTYRVRVETPFGVFPDPPTNTEPASIDIAAGETDAHSYTMSAALPEPLPATEVGFEGVAAAWLWVGSTGTGARYTTSSRRFGTTYTTEGPAPELQVLLVDDANLVLLEAGSPFEAAWVVASDVIDTDLEIPLDGAWYLVLSNAAQASAVAFGTLTVDVQPLEEGAWTGPATALELPYEILPGGRVVVSITPAG